ncbi:MAG: alr0857 family protein [Cyanobacteria bacterium P01_F01_bin.13]
MLKLNYTDNDLFLEQLTASLDTVITQRVMLAVSIGETLHVEPGRAAFLLPITSPGITQLEDMRQINFADAIEVMAVDDEFVEVSLKGTWIASSPQAESGTFIAVFPTESEGLIYRLWQATQRQTVYFI